MPTSPRCGCDDWYLSHGSRTRDMRSLVPIPSDAMDGLAEFERRGGFSRRHFLAGGVGLLVGAAGAGTRGPRALLEAAAAQAATAPNGSILVSLYLDGGNDGLNTLVPLTDARYRTLRARIGIPAAQTLPLHDSTDFGWHPSLTGLQKLYDAGKVAVLPAVDYAKPDQSHFNSSQYWRTGVVGQNLDRTGWLGRTLDVIGSRDNPLQGISATWGLDPIMLSHRAPVAAVYDPSDFDFYIPDVWNGDLVLKTMRRISEGGRRPARRETQRTLRNALTVRDELQALRVDDKHPLAPTPLPYPDSDLGTGLKNLARMLGAGFGTRVAAIDAGGGYDTHENQPESHVKLLKDLGDSLLAWQADLDARALSDRVVTLIWSEFGRRPEDNDSMGTDHGAGGLVLLVGNKVKGGIRSEFPGLATLDNDDNLLVSTEFRTVYASVLESWMGVEAGRVLPKIDNRRLDLLQPH
jgi:uncharacterized protein (DUF1501 family)